MIDLTNIHYAFYLNSLTTYVSYKQYLIPENLFRTLTHIFPCQHIPFKMLHITDFTRLLTYRTLMEICAHLCWIAKLIRFMFSQQTQIQLLNIRENKLITTHNNDKLAIAITMHPSIP